MHVPRIAFVVATIVISGSAFAASRPVVVELFTSEGCSSCPPADAYLTALSGRRDVLPLAFHVTYWNSLGWRDPFSIEAATTRQADYASHLGGGSYTPEIVVDGGRGMIGSERGMVDSAIAAARGIASNNAVPVRLRYADGSLAITIGQGGGNGKILLVGFDPRHQTPVGRGENSGRILTESNIVRSIRTIGTYDGASLRLSVPRGAGQDVAVLVQARDGKIVGAARL